MRVDHTRDQYLTDFGKATLSDRYLMEGESYQDLFARVAKHYASDEKHAQRLYDYMSNLWFMPATPILSNGGNNRGMPISCFVNEVSDDMAGIAGNWMENVWLACKGGGIGTYWGNIRSIGERVGKVGKTSGVVPFIKVQDSMTLAISQGSLRRGSAAVYMPIHHPEIEEFIEIRRPTGGDPRRKALDIHNAVVIDDAFMQAVEEDGDYDLRSPKDNHVVETVKARTLWQRLLLARIETGEPYILFIDTVNRLAPEHHKKLGLTIKTSNLCSEITLPTGIDHLGNDRTAVCCLSSLNLETYDEWNGHAELLIKDVMEFLDNVLTDFIETAPETHAKAAYSAMRERSVGLGVMGLHSLYQSRGLAWGSEAAAELNKELFTKIQKATHKANEILADMRGACPDALDADMPLKRFSNCTSVAPTASISIIAGGASPGIEPLVGNAFLQKTLSGSGLFKNPHLEKLLAEKGQNTEKVWSSIMTHEGSVQHLDFLTDAEKDVFKTAFEIDQMDIVQQAADRAPLIDQAQSVNLFLPSGVGKKYLDRVHRAAWKKGLKSLYYCRSRSLQRAEKPSHKVERQIIEEAKQGEVCEACQ